MTTPAARAQHTSWVEDRLADMIELGPNRAADYLASRLGVSTRQVVRYRAILRERGQVPSLELPPVERPGCTEPGWCACGCGRRLLPRRRRSDGRLRPPCRFLPAHVIPAPRNTPARAA